MMRTRSTKIVFAVALLLVALVYVVNAQNKPDPIYCGGDSNMCNNKESLEIGKISFCDKSDADKALCKLSSAATDDKSVTYKEHCPAGKLRRLVGIDKYACVTSNSVGCEIDETNLCNLGEHLDPKSTGKCARLEASKYELEGTVKEGLRCKTDADVKDPDGKIVASERCLPKADLYCDKAKKVCVKKSALNEKCSSTNACLENLGCNFGVCTRLASIPDFALASSAAFCESNNHDTTSKMCLPTYALGTFQYTHKCFGNGDCGTTGVCDLSKVDNAGQGVCIDVSQKAAIEWSKCATTRCVGDVENEECATKSDKCAAAKAKHLCSIECAKRADERSSGYILDCQALTVTKIEDNKCKLGPEALVKNCPNVFANNNYLRSAASRNEVANGIAAVAVILMATIAVLF